MKKSFICVLLAVVMIFSAAQGMICGIAESIPEKETPVAKIENDNYIPYNYENRNNDGDIINSLNSEIESMGGYVEKYSSEEEYQRAQKSASSSAADYSLAESQIESVKQTFTVMTTPTGSKEHGNYVESKPVANAIVRLDGVPRYTDRNGQIKVTLNREYVELYVEKEGYNPYIEIIEPTGEEKVINLKKPSDDIDIYAAMLYYDEDSVNLLNQSYGVDLFSQDDTLKAEIFILSNVKLDKVILFNNGREILSTENQAFTDINLCQFSVGDVLTIVGEVSGIKSKELKLDIEFVDSGDLDLAELIGIEEDKDINLENKAERDGESLLIATIGGVINFGINTIIRRELNKKGDVAGKRQKEKFVTLIYDNRHKTLKIIIGIDLFRSKDNGTIPGENALMTRNNALKSYEKFQRSFRSTVSHPKNKKLLPGVKELKGMFNGFKLLTKQGNFKPEMTSGIQTDITLYGFLEIDFSNGFNNIKVNDIGITVDVDFSITIAGTFMVWVVPCYWYVTFGIDFNFDFHIKNIDEVYKLIISLDPTLFIRLGVGAGINGLASVGGALQSDLDIDNEMIAGINDFDFNSSGYINLKSWLEVHFLFYSGKFFEKEWFSVEIWDTWKDKGIEREGQAATEGVISLCSMRSCSKYLSNYYNEIAESRPQIVSISDSKQLVVWVGDNPLRDESNFTQLYYAIIEDGKIGESRAVCDDGTADFLPTLINNNDDIYLAWQNCNKIFDNDATVLDVSSSLDIVVAKYDSTSNKFIDITNITNNNQLDAVPKFSNVNGKLILGWQSNSESNLFFNTGVNYVYQSNFNGTNWSTPQMILSTKSVIVDYDVSSLNGEIVLLYNVDLDDNLATMDDRQVLIKTVNEKAIVAGVNLPKLENIDNMLGMYYLKEGKVFYISNINALDLHVEQVTSNDEYVTEYKIINNRTILYATSKDELRLSLNSGDKWSWGAKLISFSSGQLNYYDATCEDGKVSVIYLENEDLAYNLNFTDYEICYDLAIQHVMVPYAFSIEKSNELTIILRNDGAFPICNFEILVDGISDSVVTLDSPIMPSEVLAYEYNLKISEYKQILLSVKLLDATDINQDNNSFILQSKVGEIALTSVQKKDNTLYYTFVNYSDFDINIDLFIDLKNYSMSQKAMLIEKGEEIIVEIDLEDIIFNVYGEFDVCIELKLTADIELLYDISSTYVTKININKPQITNNYYHSLEVSKSIL